MREKIPHYIRGVKTSNGPSQIISVDCRQNSDGACCWSAIFAIREGLNWTRESKAKGTMPQEFWAWAASRGKIDRNSWICSSNWPRIAAPIGLDWLTEQGDGEVLSASLTRAVWWVKLKIRKRVFELFDIHNWWDRPKEPIEINESEDITKLTAAKLTAQNVHTLMATTISDAIRLDLGQVQPTLGSWSLNLWRHWHDGKKICCHTNAEATKLERAAYVGGEVRVFRVGEYTGDFYLIDVNSLYPYVMGLWRYPYSLIHVQPESTVAEITAIPLNQSAIARVLIRTAQSTYPCRFGKQVRYRLGEYWTVLSDPELSVACHLGHVVQVGGLALYRSANLFGEWRARLWQIRQLASRDGQTHLRHLSKLLGVALHGRFGQRSSEWTARESYNPSQWTVYYEADENNAITTHRAIGDKHETKVFSGEEPFDSFPAIAACVTSAGRLLMKEFCEIAGVGQVYYQYIDSLLVTRKGLDNLSDAGLIDPGKIGCFKLDARANTVVIRGPGWIRVDDRLHACGIPSDEPEIAPDSYRITHSSSPQGILYNRPRLAYCEVPVTTHYPPPEIQGTVDADGWVSPPTE